MIFTDENIRELRAILHFENKDISQPVIKKEIKKMSTNRHEFIVTNFDALEAFAPNAVEALEAKQTRYGIVSGKRVIRRHIFNLLDAGVTVPGIEVLSAETKLVTQE